MSRRIHELPLPTFQSPTSTLFVELRLAHLHLSGWSLHGCLHGQNTPKTAQPSSASQLLLSARALIQPLVRQPLASSWESRP